MSAVGAVQTAANKIMTYGRALTSQMPIYLRVRIAAAAVPAQRRKKQDRIYTATEVRVRCREMSSWTQLK